MPVTEELVAVVGDTHGDATFMKGVLAEASDRDANTVVQVGDFDLEWSASFRAVIVNWLDVDPARQLLWIDGNHDNHDRLNYLLSSNDCDRTRPVSFAGMDDADENWHQRMLYCPRASTMTIGASRCLFLGGAVSVDQDQRSEGIDWWRSETISYKNAQDAAAAGRDNQIDVMFCHDSPVNVFSFDSRKTDQGSEDHRDLLNSIVHEVRPGRLFHGHYHEAHETTLELDSSSSCAVIGLGANVTGSGAVRFELL